MSDSENSPQVRNELEQDSSEKISPGRLLVPSLAIIAFIMALSTPILTLLLVDIAATFQVPVGVASQLSTVWNAATVVFGLLMSVLAVRFKHKSLFLMGVLLVVFSALGIFLAPTLSVMQVFFVLGGAGGVMISIMALTLIGNFLPLNKKAKAVSYVVAAVFLATLVGTPTVNFIANFGGWRSAYLLLALPASVAALVLGFFIIPSRSHERQLAVGKETYVRSFKQVLLNKSAAACLIGSLFFSGVIGLFAIAFFRQQFSLPRESTVYIVMVSTSLFFVGSLVTGRLVNKFGAKSLTVAGALGDGVFVILLFLAPSLWTGLALNWLHVWFAATAGAALPCLALDQVPQSRGTMMSLRSVFANIGDTIGPAVGGTMLVLSSYPALGFALGAMSLTASAIIYFLTKDPTREQPVPR